MDQNVNTWMDAAFEEFLALRQQVQPAPNGAAAGADGGLLRQQPMFLSSGSNTSDQSLYQPAGSDGLRLESVTTSASAISSFSSSNPGGNGGLDWAQHDLQQGRAFPVQTLTKKRSLCDNVNSKCSGMGCRNKDTGKSSSSGVGGPSGCSQLSREVMCPLCFVSGPSAHLLDQCPLMLKR